MEDGRGQVSRVTGREKGRGTQELQVVTVLVSSLPRASQCLLPAHQRALQCLHVLTVESRKALWAAPSLPFIPAHSAVLVSLGS